MRTEKFCRLETFGDLKFLHFGAFFSLSIEVEVIWEGWDSRAAVDRLGQEKSIK